MKSLIMRLLPLISRMVTGVLAGIVGLLVIIWFAGRYVGLSSVSSRLYVMTAVVGCYLLWLVVRFAYHRIRGRKLAENLTDGIADDELKVKMQSVLSALKSTDLGRRFRGNGALYALPWYMIIGPSAAGKSTFFSRSGLNFPFKDNEKYHFSGVGGTKNCDWWFSDQAVLIDTAGRYSNDENSEEWLGFLSLLKKNRPKVPVNGVVLALPVDELLTADGDSLQEHANNTRNRLQEIMTELGLMVPVYIVLTKCDMVRGFDAFFEDLSEAEASQPWGVYVLDQTEDRKADVVSIFRENIKTLTDRLMEQRTQKMLLSRSATKRADIYQYPTQFSAATDRLLEFIEKLFKDSPYHEKPWFAGAYFTSSVQEGDVIEHRTTSLKEVFSKALGLTYRKESDSRSFFISELFTQVIFPLKHAIRGTRTRQRFHLAAKSLTFTLAVGLTFGLGLTLAGTYTANAKLLQDYETKAVTLVERLKDNEISEIERLESLLALHEHYQDLESISTYSPLRLFTRYDLIGTHGEPMRNLLVRTLERAVQYQVQPLFFSQLNEYQSQWSDLSEQDQAEARLGYYSYLEVYQMLTSRPDQYDRKWVARKLADVWYESFGELQSALVYDTDIDRLESLVSLYLQHSFERVDGTDAIGWDKGSDVVQTAQQHLVTPPDARLLYRQLMSKGETKFDTVSLSSIVGSDSEGILRNPTEFSGIYTQSGWDDYVRAEIAELAETASKGDWVLGLEGHSDDPEKVDENAQKLEQSIRRLYFSDYSNHWTNLISQTEAVKRSHVSDSIATVKAIAEEDGLLASLFNAVAENLSLSEVPQVTLKTPDGDGENQDDGISLPKAPVISTFAALSKDLRELVKDSDDSGVADLLETYLTEVAPLASELDGIRVAADVDKEAYLYAAGVLSGNAKSKKLYTSWINVDNLLKQQSTQTQALVGDLFTSPLKTVWIGMVDASERSLQSAWQDTVYRTYQKSIQGRFPFSKSGADAAVRDVTQFFDPNAGELWEFVNADLKPFVQVRSGNWKVRTWLGYGLSFNRDVFQGVNSASNIVNNLFDEQSAATMRYWVTPMPTPGVSESILEVDDYVYRYRNEPEEWREFNWSLETSQFARVQVQLNSGSGFADQSYDGPWAFIKLLRNSQVTALSDTQFQLTFPLEMANGQTVSARYRIKADRDRSVLNVNALSNFYLPGNLFKG